MIIPLPPENYQDTKLYKLLTEKSKAQDGLAEKTTKLIQTARPLQELIIAGPFRDYTLHNPNHSKKLLHLAQYIIPDETLANLSALELSLLIMSFYIHDLGMTLTQTERERVISSVTFQEFLQVKSEFGAKIKLVRETIAEENDLANKTILETSLFQITEAALAEYLRPLHATKSRYIELIKIIKESSGRSDIFKTADFSFEEELIELCMSHNLNASSLIENKGVHNQRFPRDLVINGFSVNLQYCAAILRLVDILDFDRERTPVSLFNALGIRNKKLPGFEISLREWSKHLAIHTISIANDEIVISGDSTHPTIEHSIKEFCKIIESEVRETQAVLKQNSPEILSNYKLNLPFIVRPSIRSLGYIYKEYSIKLNETAIINLLMGESLYINTFVSLRELLQNAIDACNLRAKLEKDNYDPIIRVSIYKDIDNRFWLKVSDNGIGMDEYVLSNFFFKVGNSYYSSQEFKNYITKNQITDFTPISRFGVGLLSVFMLGEAIKVSTRNGYSNRADFKERTLVIDGVDSLAVVTEQESTNQGTIIEVLLRQGKDDEILITNMFRYIKEVIIRPSITLEITEMDGSVSRIVPDNFIRIKNSIRPQLEENQIELVQIDFERFSNMLKGKGIFIFYKAANNLLSYYDKNNQFSWGMGFLKPSFLFERFLGGSRVTVNGITMSFKRIGSLFNIKKIPTSFVLDVEVSGLSEVKYNVSRQKVFGNGLNAVRSEIFKTVDKGLRELGVFERLDDETKEMFEKAYYSRASEKLDHDLVEVIRQKLSENSEWTKMNNKELGGFLNMPVFKAKKYISYMIHEGILTK